MWAYFTRRLLLAIPTLLVSTFVVFTIVQLAPGGPVAQAMMQAQLGGAGGGEAGSTSTGSGGAFDEKAYDELRKYYGLDKPLIVRYFIWLGKVARLDFGRSTKLEEPVWELLKSRFPISIGIGLIGFFLSYLVCIPLGIIKGVKHNSAFDFTSSVLVFIGYSVPGWVLGILLLKLFASADAPLPDFIPRFPLHGVQSEATHFQTLNGFQQFMDIAWHCFLPIVAYMAGSFATLTILTKNSLMENLGQDYVRTAFAKGLSEKRVIVWHAMRNSLIPLATGLGHLFSLVLAGSFLIEKVFDIPGMGMLGYTAIINKDVNIVMGIMVISTSLKLFGNIMQDLLYCVFDPRIRFS